MKLPSSINGHLGTLRCKHIRPGWAWIAAFVIFAPSVLFAQDCEPVQISKQQWAAYPDPVQNISDKQQLERFAPHLFEDGDDQMPYRLFVPENLEQGREYPLVIFLHGSGERGDDNRKQILGSSKLPAGLWAMPEVQEQHPAFVLAPQAEKLEDPYQTGWANIGDKWQVKTHTKKGEPTRQMELLLELIDKTIAEHPIDEQRLYLTGLSMGGFGSWDLLSRQPNRYAAAIIVCGGLADNQADVIEHVPQWIFHGDSDKVVLPERATRAFAELKAAGGKPQLHIFEEVGHDSWNQAYRTPGLVDWLYSQRRVDGND